MQENIFNKDNLDTAMLEDLLIEIGIDCMGLNTISTKEQLLGKQVLTDIEKNFSDCNYSVTDIADRLGKNPSIPFSKEFTEIL